MDVLIEGKSLRPGTDFRGRNAQFWAVNFTGDRERIFPGDMAKVVVEEFSGHALKGRILSVNRGGKQIIVESEMPVPTG